MDNIEVMQQGLTPFRWRNMGKSPRFRYIGISWKGPLPDHRRDSDTGPDDAVCST